MDSREGGNDELGGAPSFGIASQMVIWWRERPEISEMRTLADISGHPERAERGWEGPGDPGEGPDSLFSKGFLLINDRVASVALLDLSSSNRTFSRTSTMVERCITNWQAETVSVGGGVVEVGLGGGQVLSGEWR